MIFMNRTNAIYILEFKGGSDETETLSCQQGRPSFYRSLLAGSAL